MAAIDAVQADLRRAKVHATGYCLGGTLLTIAAAAMARDSDHRLASLSLFAAQTDFTEAGELQLFITEDQLAFPQRHDAGSRAFSSSARWGALSRCCVPTISSGRTRSRDYLLGERDTPNDLMAWNADGTTAAGAHAYRSICAACTSTMTWPRVAIVVTAARSRSTTSQLPMFVVGTETDHIAPWHSVFKLHLQNDGETNLRADIRRPQRGRRQRARPPTPPLPHPRP